MTQNQALTIADDASFPRSQPLATLCRPASAITWLRRAIGAGGGASERSMSRTSSARWTRRKLVIPHHDAPTLKDILEGWKLMDAERKRVFAITLY
jgi:hypothetical protein